MKKFIIRYKYQLILMFIVSIVIFLPYLLNFRIFIFNADQQLSYNYFYKEWMRLIKNFINTGSFPFYSFNTFLGSNFFASKLFYVTGDTFFPLMVILSKFISNIEFNLEIMTVVYVFISMLSFFIFLYSFGFRNKLLMFVGSLIYSLGGVGSNYVGQYMFHRFFCLLPFLFACVEYYRLKNKLSYFTLIVLLLILNNYYFMFPTSIFLIFYFFFTYYYHNGKLKIINVLKESIPLIFAYLIGVLLSCFVIYPGVLFLIENDRVGQFSTLILYEFRVYLGYFYSLLSSPLTLFSKYDYLFHVGYNGHLTWYSIYTGAAIIPFIFSILFIKGNHKINSLKYFIILVNVFALVPFLSSIMHGFSEASFRWIFLITFLNVLAFLIIIEDFELYKNQIIKGGLFYILLFIILTLISILLDVIDIKSNPIHLSISIISLFLLLLYITLIMRNSLRVMLLILIVEVLFTFSLRLYILSDTFYYYVPSLDENAISYFNDIDDDYFYRIYVNPDELLPTSTMNLNQSNNMNYFSTVTYDSTYEYSLSRFLKMNNIDWHIIKIDDIHVHRMLGVKYYYVMEEKDLPIEYNWEYKYNVNHYMVFQMENYRSIGFTYNYYINSDDIGIEYKPNWNNTLIIPPELYMQLDLNIHESSSNLEILEISNNRLVGEIEVNEQQVLFISIPYNEGWEIKDNGVVVDKYNVQGGFIGVKLEKGKHYIEMQFTPPGFKWGVLMTLFGCVLFLIIIANDVFWKK